MTDQITIQANSVEWIKEQPSAIFDLIVADPPYNVGKDYGTTVDNINKYEYLQFLHAWTSEASPLLKPHGTIYVFMGFRFYHTYTIYLRRNADYFSIHEFVGIILKVKIEDRGSQYGMTTYSCSRSIQGISRSTWTTSMYPKNTIAVSITCAVRIQAMFGNFPTFIIVKETVRLILPRNLKV